MFQLFIIRDSSTNHNLNTFFSLTKASVILLDFFPAIF